MTYTDSWSDVIKHHWDSCSLFLDLTKGYYRDLSQYEHTLSRMYPASRPYDHWVNTPFGPGLNFDESDAVRLFDDADENEYIQIPAHTSLDLDTEGTIVAFLHSDKSLLLTAHGYSTYGAGIINHWGQVIGQDDSGGYLFYVQDGCLYLYSQTNIEEVAISDSFLGSGHVSSLATTFVAGEYPLGFVNGNMYDVAVNTFTPYSGNPNITTEFGHNFYYGSLHATTWQGILVFKEVLTPDEILQLHRDHLARAFNTNYANAPFCGVTEL